MPIESYNFLFSSDIWNNLHTKDFSNDTSLVFRSSLIIFLSVIVIPSLLPRPAVWHVAKLAMKLA